MLLVPLSKINSRELLTIAFPFTVIADEVNPQKEVSSLSAKTRLPDIVPED